MATVVHAGRWVFTLVFGGGLAVLFGVATLAVVIFCVVGALVQCVWRQVCSR